MKTKPSTRNIEKKNFACDVKPKKSLGQNFILDKNLTDKIAKSAGSLIGYDVLEIGPGPGGLTRSIIDAGARKVIAIEKDSRFIEPLTRLQGMHPGKLTIINQDILNFKSLHSLKPPVKVISNLPYNIGTQILINFIQMKSWPPYWTSLTLMFQTEVANRIVAQPRSKSYGRLSILTQSKTTPKILFKVPASAFTPRPKVESSVVQISPLSEPRYKNNEKSLQALVKLAFSKRRKMLRHSLRSLNSNIESALEQVGIAPESRPEELSIENFCDLATVLKV